MQVGEESPVARLARPAAAILLTAIIVAVAALQLHTIPAAKECLFEKATVNAGLGTLISCFGANTIWPMLLLFQAALLLVIVEVFYGSLSELFETVFASNKKTIFVVAAAAAVITAFYIAPGDVLLGDAYLFQPAAQIFKDAAAQGIPHHTFYWYGGSAHFEYYGQLYFAIAAATDAVFGDMNFTLKLVNWMLHIAAAAIVYLFALELTKSRKASFVAAIAYSVSYEHIARIMLHGRLMNSLTYFLFPLLLLVFEKHIKGKISKTAAVAGLSLTAAAIFLSNPGDGTFLLVSAAFYFAIRVLQLQGKREMVQTAAIAAALFMLLTSFWTIPFVLEKATVNAGARVGELTSISFRPEILKEIISFPGQRGIAIAYYFGIVQVVLAAIAAILIIRQRRNQALIAVAIAAAITLLLMLAQSPRYAPALVLALAVLAGIGSIYAAEILAAKARSAKLLRFATAEQIFLVLAALIVLDSAAAIVQPYYPDFSTEKKLISERIPAEAGFRTVDLHSDRRTFYPSLTYLATKTESLFGSLLEGAPKSTNYAIAIATRAAKEHYDDKAGFSNQTLDGLYLFNVKYAALHPEQTGSKGAGRNFKAAVGLEKQMAVAELENSQVIASRRIMQYGNSELEREENYFLRERFETREINYGITDEITQLMGINREKATAEAILVRETFGANETRGSGELSVEIVSAETKHARVKIKIEQNSDAFLQLSYAASPEVSVLVDGKEVHQFISAAGTIVIKTSKGKHTIEIVAMPSELRKWLLIISSVTAAVLLGALIQRKIFKRA